MFDGQRKDLEENALLYPIFWENYRKVNFGKRYAIFYTVDGNDVTIEFIYDMRMKGYNKITSQGK
jgi:hypothetical protein